MWSSCSFRVCLTTARHVCWGPGTGVEMTLTGGHSVDWFCFSVFHVFHLHRFLAFLDPLVLSLVSIAACGAFHRGQDVWTSRIFWCCSHNWHQMVLRSSVRAVWRFKSPCLSKIKVGCCRLNCPRRIIQKWKAQLEREPFSLVSGCWQKKKKHFFFSGIEWVGLGCLDKPWKSPENHWTYM